MKFLVRFFFKTLRTVLGPAMLLKEALTRPQGVVRSEAGQQAVNQACNALALYWCQRMEYFYSIYTGQDDLNYVFTLDDVQSAPHPDKVLTDLGHNSDLEQACQARLATVIALVPVSL